MIRVLVTGASGFLGSHVVDRCLATGYRVRAVVRASSDRSYLDGLGSGVEVRTGSLLDRAFVAEALQGVACVVHAAARVGDVGSYDMFYASNVTLTEVLLACAREQGVGRFVFVSSPSVVAACEDQLNLDERAPFSEAFLNAYCETKAIAEQRVLVANEPRFVTCAVRPRAVWGPRDVAGPLARLLRKLQRGALRDVSGGRKISASMCYVRNAADACVKAMTADGVGGQAYFIADAHPVDVWSFADRMATLFGLGPVRRAPPRWIVTVLVTAVEWIWKIPYLRNNVSRPLSRYAVSLVSYSTTYCLDKARRDLGYRAEVELESALAEYCAWVEHIGGVEAYLARVAPAVRWAARRASG